MCLTPIQLNNEKTRVYAVVPCGKCPKCKQRRANSWIFRLLKEEKEHTNSLFVTLTYAPEHVPITKRKYMSLCKRDLQLFFKRLRKRTRCKTIKYYACGEYGTDTWRPHYHAIMFDVTHDDIAACWTQGHVYIGQVTGASIGYCTKYICKDKRVPLHQNDDRKPEFSLMSKRMGSNYMTPQMVKWHKENKASYVVVDGGFKQALPRYYRDRIFTDEERLELNIATSQQFKEKLEKAMNAAGSPTQYYRNRQEAVIAYIQNNKDNSTSNRKKI